MKFSYSKMDACCTEMQVAVNNIKEVLNDISAIRSQLSKSDCWSGQAHSFYLDKMNRLTNQFDEIKMELDQIIPYLRNIMEGYHSLDYTIQTAIKNVMNK